MVKKKKKYNLMKQLNFDENKPVLILFVAIIILVLILALYGWTNDVDRIEKRLKTKLRETAAEIFETDKWLNGAPEPDTYIATLNDLKHKLGKDISLFEKYECNNDNTRVEFIVMPATKAKQTNYKYNIILDCNFDK